MKSVVLAFSIFWIILSCSSAPRNSKEIVYPELQLSAEPSPPSKNDALQNADVHKTMIIRDARMTIRVSEMEAAKSMVDSLTKTYGGYYSNESFNNTDYQSDYSLIVRIPASNFEDYIRKLESESEEILYKDIHARDITDEYIDLEVRLANKKNYLKRYNELVKQAKSIKEILEIEEKTRVLEEEIESTTGRLKYLADQVDYSTLNLQLIREKDYKFKPTRRDKFFEKLKQSTATGWFAFIDFLLVLIKIWPFLLIIAAGYFFWRKYRNSRKNKKQN